MRSSILCFFFFSSRRRHTRSDRDWSSDVCSSDLERAINCKCSCALQGETVKSARAFAVNRPLVVSPITLKRRYNAHATVAEAEQAPDELPDAIDLRQMSLFGAVWTAGSIKYLAESGAASLTYYETAGWRGLMERETGSS